jgi:hypothetical protein
MANNFTAGSLTAPDIKDSQIVGFRRFVITLVKRFCVLVIPEFYNVGTVHVLDLVKPAVLAIDYVGPVRHVFRVRTEAHMEILSVFNGIRFCDFN